MNHMGVVKRQCGSVLVISLIILLTLTLLGIGGMSTTVMQEKMVGNTREREAAFQAAEAALRDAEEDVRANIALTTPFSRLCSAGRCEPAKDGQDVWENTSRIDWDDANDVIAYGAETGADDIPGVGAQPKYILERLPVVLVGESLNSSEPPSSNKQWYRATAQGYGRNVNAKAMVQSVFRK